MAKSHYAVPVLGSQALEFRLLTLDACLPKQADNDLHGEKKTARDRGKWNKPEMLVELRGACIDCVHNNRGSGDFG